MKPGRNDPCICGSGKKYKNCCEGKAAPRVAMPADAEVMPLVALYNARRYLELEGHARKLIERYPYFGFGWKLLGGALHMQGKNALPAFQKAAELMPAEAEILFNLGVAQKGFGLLADAAESYRRALKLKPDYAEAHSNLGNVLKDLGQHEEAVACYRRALQYKPGSADVHNSLGTALKDIGQAEEAIASFQHALQLKPDFADAHYNLGNVLKDLGRPEEAAASYRRAIECRPDLALAHNNLGVVLHRLGKLDAAVASYRQALKLEPDSVMMLNNIAVAWKELGRHENVLPAYRRVAELEPGYAAAHCNLGKALKELGQLEEAVASYRKALAIEPDFVEAHVNLGFALQELGYFEEARDCYRRGAELGFEGARVHEALMLPSIIGTREKMLASRAEFEHNLDRLIAEQVRLDDPLSAAIKPNFYLAFHGMNDRDLQVKVAKFFELACPSLLYVAPHCAQPKPEGDRSIRVGFLSAYFTYHSVSFCFSRIIEKISSRAPFEVSLLSDRPIDEKVYAEFTGKRVHLPYDLEHAREAIAALELDVLIYLDIGMDSLSYFLAFARLARTQCVMGGHPVTTGIANLDYFLSTELTEPAHAQEHYSEKLYLFRKPTSYFSRPVLPAKLKSRGELGLPEGKRLYMCPMKLQKMHPDFDEAMAGILALDKEGRVVLFEDGKFPVWKENLLKRFAKTIPAGVMERIIFMPWLRDRTDFISTLAEADVILDPFHFGTGSTLSFIFSTGTPLVTLPSEFMRGRIGMGHCRALGLDECIAEDAVDYVRKAVAIATDRSLREKISAKILANNSVYYGNLQAVEELAGFFLAQEPGWRVAK